MRDHRPALEFSLDGVVAIAELNREAAPNTIEGLLRAVPLEGSAFHGIYSGSEIAFFIPSDVWLPVENATSRVLPGELGYFKFRGGEHYGFPEDRAELCWFYDRDATPSMPDGPVRVNIIGRFTEGWDAFEVVCRAMRSEGDKPVRVRAV